MERWGVDPKRYHCVQTKDPAQIFDTIKRDLSAAIESGIKIKLLTIDSLAAIEGLRTVTDETMTTQQRGDHAMTIQKGLQWIMDTVRRNKIALILTTQIRAEQDQAQLMRHRVIRPAISWGGKHFAEFQMLVQPNDSKEGRSDFLGNELVDESVKDLKNKGEVTGNRIRATMEEACFGPKKRTGEFTVNYREGIVNQHEEIFRIAVGLHTQHEYDCAER
jgi:RecA/RadA recombinase